MKSLITLLASLALSFAAEHPPLSNGSDGLLECKLLGFGDSLDCSTCKSFEDIVADQSKSILCYGTAYIHQYLNTPYYPRACCCQAKVYGIIRHTRHTIYLCCPGLA